MRSKIKYLLIFLSILLLTISGMASALDIGGEMKTTFQGIFQEDKKMKSNLQETLNLELFLPSSASTEARFELDMIFKSHDLATGEKSVLDTAIKKMYLRSSFENFDLTAGRQPVSWSYGAMLNPVDYNLGAVVMDEAGSSKFINAIEVYVPFNWNSGLAILASFPENSDDIKWGLRGRTGYKGYDLTLNYVQEVQRDIMGLTVPAFKRIGANAKGDLGVFGVYGALAYVYENELEDGSFLYQIGADYSYSFLSGSKFLCQLEYLNLEGDKVINGIFGLPAGILPVGDKLELLAANINYTIDDFSSIGLLLATAPEDGSLMILPRYSNMLGNGLSFNLDFGINQGETDSLFGFLADQSQAELVMNSSISYPF